MLTQLLMAYGLLLWSTSKCVQARNECFDEWSSRGEPATCVTSKDCKDANAKCVYSLISTKHICCKPNEDVVFPKCPQGRRVLVTGMFTPVICIPQHSAEDENCPQGYECAPSEIEFTKDQTQPNYICCEKS